MKKPDPALTKKVRDGEKARQLLKDPMLKGALDDIELFWQNELKETKANQIEQREHCYRMIRCCEDFRHMLTRKINKGLIAKDKIQQAQQEIMRIVRTEY